MLNDDNGSAAETTTASTAPSGPPAETFIETAEDQPDHWYGYQGTPNEEEQITALDEAIAHVVERHMLDGERSDLKVNDIDTWVFGLVDGVAFLVDPKSGDRGFALRHTGFGHLCARAKAPPGYLRSIPTRYSIPSLNWGIKNRSEGPAMIRLANTETGPEARAIVSQRYTPLDDSFTLPALRAALDATHLLDGIKARVVATGLTTVMRLGIEGDAISVPGTDEIAEVALDYTNGEVGNRAVHLSPSVYLRNRGLATRRGGLRLRHLGDPNRLAESFRDSIPGTLADSRKLRDQIVKAVDRAIGDLVGEADKLRNLGLSIAEARDVLRGVASGAGVTLPQDTAEWEGPIQGIANVRAYDVFLAVTQAAEGKSIDRRLDLEEVAAKYLARATK